MKRYNVEVPVKSQIVKKDTKTAVTGIIRVITKDLSSGGLRLKWPKGWKCLDCTKCLGWVFNDECRFKEDMEPKINRYLSSGLLVKLRFLRDFIKEKEYLAKIVWTRDADSNLLTYEAGLAFENPDSSLEKLFLYKKRN